MAFFIRRDQLIEAETVQEARNRGYGGLIRDQGRDFLETLTPDGTPALTAVAATDYLVGPDKHPVSQEEFERLFVEV